MKYTIVKHHDIHDYTECIDEEGKTHRLDLTTDASFKEINDALSSRMNAGETYKDIINSFAGKTFECERTFPYIPCYFVSNAQFINSPNTNQ